MDNISTWLIISILTVFSIYSGIWLILSYGLIGFVIVLLAIISGILTLTLIELIDKKEDNKNE
jgi:hypothetical protein